MASFRILIVDDQHDIRDMLRYAVETLGPNFIAVAVPSGEEALLEITTQKVDILVADLILPGINGLELMKKAKSRNPNLKIILVTGTLDHKLRRQATNAGADAFFVKPMDPADFLDTLESFLGIVGTKTYTTTVVDEGEKPVESISQCITRLHKELGTISSILLDDRGKIHAQAGDLPDTLDESSLFPLLTDVLDTSGRISHILGAVTPNGILYFSGTNFDIILSHVSSNFSLMELIPPIGLEDDLSKTVKRVSEGVRDLYRILLTMGVRAKSDYQITQVESELEDGIIDDSASKNEAPILDALFQGVDVEGTKTEDADAFWDNVTERDTSNEFQNADMLTYEQALRLGLAPEEDEE